MSETALEEKQTASTHKLPLKAWVVAALLFVFGVKLLAAKDE